MIPNKCILNGKIYDILNIDLQGGYFTLFNPEAKRYEVRIINWVDIEDCEKYYYEKEN
jgi:hypothetical protein